MQFTLGAFSGTDATSTASDYPDDTWLWTHWAFVYNTIGNGMSIFRNGVAQEVVSNGGTSGGPTTATGAIHLGVWKFDTADSPFNGDLDEFLLFEGRALSSAEVLTIFQTDSTPTNMLSLTISLSFDVDSSLGTDFSCGGSNDAASATGVVAVQGVVCGSVSAASLACGRCVHYVCLSPMFLVFLFRYDTQTLTHSFPPHCVLP